MILHSDIGSAAKIIPLPKGRRNRLVKTNFANLYRDRFSGIYFCHAMVSGKLLRKSLKTKAVTIAKLRLDELIFQTRMQRALSSDRPDVEDFKCRHLADLWAARLPQKIKRDKSPLKPRAIQFRLETLKILRRTWPKFDALKPDTVTTALCEDWADKFWQFKNNRGHAYYAGRFNGCLETLRSIFKLAVHLGLAAKNPALPPNDQSPLNRMRVGRKNRKLPERKQMADLLRRLRARPERRRALWFVRVLMYSFKRPVSLRALMPADVDLAGNLIRWAPVKHATEFEKIPMAFQLRVVMKELLKLHPGGGLPLLPILDPHRALNSACREAGIRPAITSGDLRHWSTTYALFRAELPPAVVASIRGDKDGGAMLLKHYKHPNEELLRAAVKRL